MDSLTICQTIQWTVWSPTNPPSIPQLQDQLAQLREELAELRGQGGQVAPAEGAMLRNSLWFGLIDL